MNVGTFASGIGIIVFALSLYVLWQIRQIILLLFTAVVIANAINVLVKKFQGWRIKRGYAIVLSLLAIAATLVSFFLLIVPAFIDQFKQLAKLVPKGLEEAIDWINTLKERLSPDLVASLPDVNELSQQLQPLVRQLLGGGLTFFYSSLGTIVSTLFLLILTLMLLADPKPYRQGFIRLFPSFYRRRVDEILVLCDSALQGWLIGIFFNMMVITIFSFLGLVLLGIPSPLAQALLAGILTFIPNVGPAISVLVPMAIALLEAPWKSLAVLILYFLIQQLETNVLTPLVMAQQVSLLPAITLLSQLLFASGFGFLGLFLALPLTVVLQVWFQEVLLKDILDRWDNQKETLEIINNMNVELEVISGSEHNSSPLDRDD